jgi:ribosomal protein S18 acetylase RimI-like enzyme
VAGKVFLRFAQASDIERLPKDGVIVGPPPSREPWSQRIIKWLTEQRAGRRLVLVAEDDTGLLGMVQIVFKLPLGYEDPEAANGIDIAMMEGLRMREGIRSEIGTELVGEVQRIAMKRNIKTLTFLLPMHNTRAINQARTWGFEEFRIMPEPGKMLAFFRKSVE